MTQEERKSVIDNAIILLNMKEVMEVTGWSEVIVRRMFANESEFPAIKKGKENQVELEALKKYLSERRVSR